MKLRNFLWLLFLAALWGPSFLFIKVAVANIPPLTLAMSRVGVAGVLLYVILRLQGRNLPPLGRVWLHFAFAGLVQNAIPFVLFGWGEQYIDSALAAILNGTTPLFTLLLAHFFTTDDRLTPTKAVGTLIGFGGLTLLIAPSLMGGVKATTWGLIAVAVAATCYGIAIVYGRHHLRGLPPLVAPTAQMLLATLFLMPVSLGLEQPFRLAMPSWPAIASLLTLGIFGTGVAFMIYYWIMERTSATYVSMVTYLVPVFGVILGVVVLGEQLSWNAYIGCALILLGVMIVNGIFRAVSWWQRPTDVAVRP